MNPFPCTGLVYYRHAIGNLGRRRKDPPERNRPFIARNRAAYERARLSTPCHRCGYVGPSLLLRAPEGHKSPGQLLQSSEAAFKRAMKRAVPTCLNCNNELHGAVPVPPPRGRVPIVVSAPPRVLHELSRSDSVDTQRSEKMDTTAMAESVTELVSEACRVFTPDIDPRPDPKPQSPSA